MYMDFSALVNVTSSNKHISTINFYHALLNDIVEVIAMKLEMSISTITPQILHMKMMCMVFVIP